MTRLIYTLLLCLLLPVQSWAAVAWSTPTGVVGNGFTTFNPTYPTGSTNAGDLLVMCVTNKYPSNVPSTPSGWTLPTNGQGTGDDSLGAGADTGATFATVFYKIAAGGESGTIGVENCTSCNSVSSVINRYTNATGAWLIAAANGGDNLTGTSWVAVMGTDPDITGGDMVIACSARNSDAGLGSAEALTTVGVTYGTAAERYDNGYSGGDDQGIVFSDHAVTSGASGGALTTVSFTNGTNTAGGTVILRIREDTAALPAIQAIGGFLGAIIK